jgi:uncharacterized protein (TIGR02594 family)
VSASEQVERAAELLERLLGDADFRARFRAKPAEACREAGLQDLADELTFGGTAMQTLEQRESRSSLLGVLMVAALEGAGALELGQLVGSGLSGDAAAAANIALTRSGMQAVQPGAGLHAPPAPHLPGAQAVGRAAAAGLAGESTPAAGSAAAAAPGATAGSAAPALPAAPSEPAAAAASAAPAESATPASPAAASAAASAAPAQAPGSLPGVPPTPAGEAWPDSAPAAGTDAAGWPSADAQAAASSGAAGGAFRQLVENPNIEVAPAAQGELLSGRVDQRLAPVLDTLARDHRLGVNVVPTGGVAITTVDGKPVSTGNPDARELMGEIAGLDASVRPSQVGGPWRLAAPGFFSDAQRENQISLAFEGPPPAAQAAPAPADPAAGGVAETAAAAPAGGKGFDPAAAALDYPGNDAGKPAIAKWMGDWAERAGLPRELPVMASLVESGLTNIDHGDRDSLGFFQMRTGIWMRDYPDFPKHPELQLKWFIDHAVAVKESGGGQADAAQFGEWIADVERPAAEYRGRYQLRLEEARGLLSQAGDAPAAGPAAGAAAAAPGTAAVTPSSPEAGEKYASVQFLEAVEPGPAAVEPAAAASAGGGSAMVEWLSSGLGTLEGSATHQQWASSLGYSASLPWCSIFVANGLRELGLPLPQNPAYSGAWLDWDGGQKVALDAIQPGDIVVFDYGDGGITDHVAVYVGDGNVIGGNQSDSVTKLPLNREAVVGVVRPNYPG